ncbi:MAG: M28 family peptidase [Bacteroidales bacterium]|nr:M28 family peptidase [Bacteroidales bacterium]
MKKSALFTLLSLAASVCASAQDDWKRESTIAVSEISGERIYREVSFLTDSLCNGRGTGTAGGSEAAFWISRKFEGAGLLPVTEGYGSHFVTPTGASGHNIIGMIPGALSMPRDRYIIVGAHYDHLGVLDGKIYPGADANASGTVVLTSLADIFGAMKEMGKVYDTNIIFVAFDAKEMGMSGSASLWKLIDYSMLKDPLTGESVTKDKIKAMVNIDQIGSSLSPVHRDREDYLLMLGNESLPKDKRMNIEACNMLHDINLDLCLSYYGSKTFTDVFYRLSDQKVFVENKIPAVFFTSGITMNTNKTRDNAESLNYEVLRKRINLIYRWIESML